MAHPVGERADPEQVAVVLAAVRSAAPARGEVVVVSVDGRSGAGKTLLATEVAEELGCPVVHLDEIYPGWDGLAEGVALLTEQVLEPVATGAPAAYQRWDWMRNRPGRTVSVHPSRHLVVEGCGVLTPPALVHAAVRVWVEAPDAVRKQRALARDGETFAPHWERWAAQEDLVFAGRDPRDTGALVLWSGPP